MQNASMECLENRKLLSATIIGDKFKVKNLFDAATGNPINQSLLTVKFSEQVTAVDADRINLFGYVTDPASRENKKVVIRIVDAYLAGPDFPNNVIIKTDRVVPATARINMLPNSGNGSVSDAVTTVTGPTTSEIQEVGKGTNRNRFLLASRAFKPEEPAFFTAVADLNGTPGDIADTVRTDEATVRYQLGRFLDGKITEGFITSAEKTDALSRFDSANTKTIVPDHNLRAALISLVGTAGEATINAVLDGANRTLAPWSSLVFGSLTGGLDAETTLTAGRLATVIDDAYAGEPFQSLGARLAHEAVHQDGSGVNSVSEEVVGNIVQATVHAQNVFVEQGIAWSNTRLTKQLNDQVLALLNSGAGQNPRVGYLTAAMPNDYQNVFARGTIAADSFVDLQREIYSSRVADVDTVSHGTMRQFLAGVTTLSVPNNDPLFSETLIDQLDRHQVAVTDPMAIRLAGIYKLTVG